MARTRSREARDPGDPLVRVRGGRKGFQMIALSDWKAQIKERKQRKTKRDKQIKEKAKRKRP